MSRRKPPPSKPARPLSRRARIQIGALVGFLLIVVIGSTWLYTRALDAKRPAAVNDIKALLLATTPRTALSKAAADAMVEQLQKSGGVDPKVVEIIPKEIDAFFLDAMDRPDGLSAAMTPVFAQRFTSAEIAELVTFYTSPLGKKVSEQMPVVAAQTSGIAQQWLLDHWGELSQRVEASLKAQGVTLPSKPAATAPPEVLNATAAPAADPGAPNAPAKR